MSSEDLSNVPILDNSSMDSEPAFYKTDNFKKGLIIVLIIVLIVWMFWEDISPHLGFAEKAGESILDVSSDAVDAIAPIVERMNTRSGAHVNIQPRNAQQQFGSVGSDPNDQHSVGTERMLEGMIAGGYDPDRVYDFSDPATQPHGQLLQDVSDLGWDPAKMNLDQATFDSHHEFVNDSYISGQGASISSGLQTNDHLTAPNPWVGLRRVDYTSAFSQRDARTVSSECPSQIARENAGGYTL